ncbi:MAG: CDP-glycerol glycerophosphotransferase family protein, partial [Bacteriovoracaceae bacterium]|nr:CDP-glycerol glycerophosphotransferase family protein [Bacteriovoracaceae bacterium]
MKQWIFFFKQVVNKLPFGKKVEGLTRDIFRYFQAGYYWYILRKVRNYSKVSGPIKVYFLIQFPASWNVYRSIYNKMEQSEHFIPTVLSLPRIEPLHFTGVKDNDKIFSFFKEKGIRVVQAYSQNEDLWFDLEAKTPDVVFLETPYDDQRCPQYHSDVISKYTRLCYIQYAFIIVGGVIESMFFDRAFFYCCWKIFTETKYHRELYRKHQKVIKDKYTFISGYPKFDAYLEDKFDDSIWCDLDVPMGAKKILWCTHWTVTDEHLNASTFFKFKDVMLQFALDHEDVAIIFRPHPLLFGEIVAKSLMTQDEIDVFLDKLNSIPNA